MKIYEIYDKQGNTIVRQKMSLNQAKSKAQREASKRKKVLVLSEYESASVIEKFFP